MDPVTKIAFDLYVVKQVEEATSAFVYGFLLLRYSEGGKPLSSFELSDKIDEAGLMMEKGTFKDPNFEAYLKECEKLTKKEMERRQKEEERMDKVDPNLN